MRSHIYRVFARWFTVLGLVALVAGPAAAGVIGFFPFEGTANDASGNGHNGVLSTPAPVYVAGYEGLALQFGIDGNSTYVTVPININPSVYPQFTMGAWVYVGPEAVSDVQIRGILSHDDGGYDRHLGIDTRCGPVSPCYGVFNGSGIYDASLPVASGEWVFLAVAYDQGNAIRFAVNGSIATYTGSTTLGPGLTTVTIGRNPTYDYPFIGLIDNVFFFDEYLSVERLREIQAGGAAAVLGAGSIPEPGSLGLVAAGGIAVLLWSRRRRARL